MIKILLLFTERSINIPAWRLCQTIDITTLMAPPKSFLIKVDNGDKPFFPGQSINGKVVLHCREKKTVRAIYLNLIGRGYVKWTESGGNNTTVTYKAEESYFNFRVKLWGDGQNSQQLEAGNYEFPFSLQLPSSPMPSSYEGSFGNIRYWLEARLDRPRKTDHVTKFAFTLLERVDLEAFRENLIHPLRFEKEKTICCLCCQSGPVSFAVSTDHGGYCAGENILVTARVENNSNLAVGKLQAKLIRKVDFHARGKTRSRKILVSQMHVSSIAATETFDWNRKPLLIPACPPTSSMCGIIHIRYVLHVTLVLPFAIDIVAKFPITIGTVPFDSISDPSTAPSIGFARTQAVNIADNQYTMGQTEFAPMYSMVQMSPHPQMEVENLEPPLLKRPEVPKVLSASNTPLPIAPVYSQPLPLAYDNSPPPYPGHHQH